MELRSLIFDPSVTFCDKAARIFRYQVENNPVYSRYVHALGVSANQIPDIDNIPLLPVRAFKEARVSTLPTTAPLVFESSGTSSMERSRHDVHDPSIYRESVLNGFDRFYPNHPVIWAYMPGYRDNPSSSLIQMIDYLIERDEEQLSRWISPEQLADTDLFERVIRSGRRLILFGAAFGLLDLLEQSNKNTLPEGSIVLETGGMKTHRREMSREDLHLQLSDGSGCPPAQVHSEYGMCELLSQAYTAGGESFCTPEWMRVTIRNPENWMEIQPDGEEGLIGVVDLANLYSCSFLLTGDRGVAGKDGGFQVSGRWNPVQMRGCNFLIDSE